MLFSEIIYYCHCTALPLCSTQSIPSCFLPLMGCLTRLVLDDTVCCSSLPTLLIHWLVDWEASLAIWENNVISGWAELLNPLWDYSLLSASVITDHRQKKETKVFPLLYASIFILTSSVWRELFSIAFENWHSLYCSPSLFSLLAVWQCFKVQENKFSSFLYLLGRICNQHICE